MTDRGTIFHIQRFSVHDGPGIRTTVFFKGCSLRCFWCHNPEGLRRQQEVRFSPSRCIGCMQCVEVCPTGAHATDANGERIFLRDRCEACGRCADACFAEALEMAGQELAANDVVQQVLRDVPFYASSGGGVTLSGGDPVLQPAFARQILERCRQAGIHTAIETAANCSWDTLVDLLPLTDLVMMDLKHIDPEKHLWATGVSNERILANAGRLVEAGVQILFRAPIVPTVNDTPEEFAEIAQFVRRLDEQADRLKRPTLELLTFHRLAGDKYRSLGLDHRAENLESPAAEKMAQLAEIAASYGILVKR